MKKKKGALSWIPRQWLESELATSVAEIVTISWRLLMACLLLIIITLKPVWIMSKLWLEALEENDETSVVVGNSIAVVLTQKRVIAYSLDEAPKILWTKEFCDKVTVDSEGQIILAQDKQLVIVSNDGTINKVVSALDSKCIFLSSELCITKNGQILILSRSLKYLSTVKSTSGIGAVRQLSNDELELEGYTAIVTLKKLQHVWQCGELRRVARDKTPRTFIELLDATPIIPQSSIMTALAATLKRTGLNMKKSNDDDAVATRQEIAWRGGTLRLDNGILSFLTSESSEEIPVDIQTGEQNFSDFAIHHTSQSIVLALSDGSIRICRSCAADGLVAQAAGSLEAALRESRRLGFESQLTARRCVWEKSGSLDALAGDADEIALHWIAETAAQDHRSEAHDLGMRALEKITTDKEKKQLTCQKLLKTIQRSKLYDQIQAAVHIGKSLSIVGETVESRLAAQLNEPLPWTWTVIRDAKDEHEIFHALARFGVILENFVLDDPESWLDMVPETAEIPSKFLNQCSDQVIAARIRAVDARCGQIVLAEQLCQNRPNLKQLHCDCWHLARLATHREARTVFSKVTLKEWEQYSIAKQLTCVLDLGEALALELLPAMLPPQQYAVCQDFKDLADACLRSSDIKKIEMRARIALLLLGTLPISDEIWRCYLQIVIETGVDGVVDTTAWSEPIEPVLRSQLASVRQRLDLARTLRESYNGLKVISILQASPTTVRRQLSEALGCRNEDDDAKLLRLLLRTRDKNSSDRTFVADVGSLCNNVVWPVSEKSRLEALAVSVATQRVVSLDLANTDLRQLDDDVLLSELDYNDLNRCERWLRRGGSAAATVRRQLLGHCMLFGEEKQMDKNLSVPANVSSVALNAWELTCRAILCNSDIDERPAMDDSSLIRDVRDWASRIVVEQIIIQIKILYDTWRDSEIPLWRRRTVVGAVLAVGGIQEEEIWVAWCAAEAACIDFDVRSGRIEAAARGTMGLACFVLHLQSKGEAADLASALCIEAAVRVARTTPERELRSYIAAVALRAARPSSSPQRYFELVSIISQSSTSIRDAVDALRAYREEESVALLLGAQVSPETGAALYAARDDELARGGINIPNPSLITHLVSLGFSQNGATRAAMACDNSTELAISWCADHCNDPDFELPLPLSTRHPPGARLRSAKACLLFLRLSRASRELLDTAKQRIQDLTSASNSATRTKPSSDGLAILERRWDRALQMPEEEAKSLLGLKTSKAALAVAEAGVGTSTHSAQQQRVLSLPAQKDVTAFREAIEKLGPQVLADFARRRYAATSRASHMELACRFLAEHLGSGHPETRKAQAHALLLRRLVQVLGRSNREGLEALIDAKALCGDLFSSSSISDDSGARDSIAKAADADTAMSLARLVPKLRGGVQPSDVWSMAMSTELRLAFTSDTDIDHRPSLRTLAARQEQISEQVVLKEILQALPPPQRAEYVLTQKLGLEPRTADKCLRALAAVRATPINLRQNAISLVLGADSDVHNLGLGLASKLEANQVRAILIGLNVSSDDIFEDIYREAGAAAARDGPDSVQTLLTLSENVPIAVEAVRRGVSSVLQENPSTATKLATIVADEQNAKLYSIRDLVRAGWSQLQVDELSDLLPQLLTDTLSVKRADLIWQVLALLEEGVVLGISAAALKTLFFSPSDTTENQFSQLSSSWLELCRRTPDLQALVAHGCPIHSVDIEAELEFFNEAIQRDRTGALLFGLNSPNPSLRLHAASILEAKDTCLVPALRRSGAWRSVLPTAANISLLRAACSPTENDQKSSYMADFPTAAACGCLVAATSLSEVLISADLLANALGVHSELRTVDTAIYTCEHFLAIERDAYFEGEEKEVWFLLRSAARSALASYLPQIHF
uniref:UBA domain-containing protein n=1 Tax=Aureoumbra lagunensis TaxID=44058 RepID=A0A7S3JPK3_9STRA